MRVEGRDIELKKELVIMKKIILGVIIMSSTQLFGQEDIYNALNVEARSVPAPRTMIKLKKEVEGLTCFKTNHILRGDSYSCEARVEKFNSSLIYETLDVEEVYMIAPKIQIKTKKSAGTLSCIKIDDIRRGLSYSCKIKF